MTQDKIIEQRKEKIISFLKQRKVWVLGFLIIAIILGIYIRSMPLHDHGGKPGLWDITKNDYTLGPDLDPWLFTRYAKIIVEEGHLPRIDKMRYVPLGYDTSKGTRLLPYMIALTYYIVNLFGTYSVEFAAALFPVIMFALTIISFFLFVREVFVRKDEKSKTRADIIALISTFFMIVIPAFLSRTVAGIPEKESAAFFFMFLSFYLFLKGWKSDSLKKSIFFGTLAGISTAMMGLIWGGVIYVFVTISIASLLAFILNKVNEKEFILYSLWISLSFGLMLLFSNRFSLKGLIASLDSGLAFLVFFIMTIHFILWNTKLKKIKFFQKTKIPENIISLIAAVIFGVVLVSIIFSPSFVIEKLKALNQILFKPVTGRWNITVAENRQPFFKEWGASFGPFLKNIPILFWLFFIGSVVLFKEMLNKIKKKDAWILTFLYILFFFGLVFSRYSSTSIFNGENFISKAFYYCTTLLLLGTLIYYYIKYYKEGNKGFEMIDYEYLFLFSLFALCLFTARSAVRLIMVLGPVAPIFVSYLVVESYGKLKKIRDETFKMILGCLFVIIVILSAFCFFSFYKTIKVQAYNFIPSHYNQQWQKAMKWVRENTEKDAVFAHWWDYGYWVQSIGERPTILDGGNSITFWNYYMGRLVLTADNQSDALEFLYNHDADYLLIDSTDIGKYGAFSSIGSDENYDRYGWIPTMVSDERQIRETSNGTIRVYSGGSLLDEDLIYKDNETEVFLPGKKAGIAGIILETIEKNNKTEFKQPIAVFVYNNNQYRLPLRYLYVNNTFIDFEKGVEGCAMILQKIDQTRFGIRLDNLGALIYISPRVMRGMLAQKYLLNDCFNNFPNFKLVHSEPNLIIDSLRKQGLDLNEFIYFHGVQGPIKIWKIEYTGKEKERPEYLDTDASKYLSWKL